MAKNIYLTAAGKTAAFVGIMCLVGLAFSLLCHLWMWLFDVSYDAAWTITLLLGIIGFTFDLNLWNARHDKNRL